MITITIGGWIVPTIISVIGLLVSVTITAINVGSRDNHGISFLFVAAVWLMTFIIPSAVSWVMWLLWMVVN